MHITREEIERARARIPESVHTTPVVTSETLNSLSGTRVFLKCEQFQKTGSFKARGAVNAVACLSRSDRKNGVITHSSGNHGQALAYAARRAGIKAYIVVPENAPEVKKAAMKHYGGEVILCRPNLKSRVQECERVQQETGAVFIPPYDHRNIVEGQATCAAEFLEQVPELDVIIAPVGGGGLLSGTCAATQNYKPNCEVAAGEPAGADDAYRSLKSGKRIPQNSPQTLADGLRASLGAINFKLLQEYSPRIFLVTDEEIVNALRFVFERTKLLIEPSSAVPVAAVLKNKSFFKGKNTGIILSGGNADFGSYFNSLPTR